MKNRYTGATPDDPKAALGQAWAILWRYYKTCACSRARTVAHNVGARLHLIFPHGGNHMTGTAHGGLLHQNEQNERRSLAPPNPHADAQLTPSDQT